MSQSNMIQNLKSLLADSYSLYIKTQNYHWNVTGPHFKALHVLFEEQYTDLAVAIDTIAERIRSLGEKAPGTFRAYQEMSEIKDGDENARASVMVKDLAEDQQKILETLKIVLQSAQEVGDEVTIGLVVDRMTFHEKSHWMLISSLE